MPSDVVVPVYETVNGKRVEAETTVQVLDVHEVLDYLHSELLLQCPMEAARHYWAHMRSHGMEHAVRFPGTDSHVPFSLYGDELCLGDPGDKCTGIFLSLTLWKPKAAKFREFLLFAMSDKVMIHEGLKTLTPVLRHIVWSCNIAFTGVYPSCSSSGNMLPPAKQRKAGKSFADGRVYACAELKGDWKWHERVLRLQNTPVSVRCCFLCQAEARDTNLRFYDLSPGANWMATVFSTAGFIANAVRPGTLSLLPALYA